MIFAAITIIYGCSKKSDSTSTPSTQSLFTCRSGGIIDTAAYSVNGQWFLASAFTPNGDGVNDVWRMYGTDNTHIHPPFTNYSLTVKNTSGTTLFTTTNFYSGWDGKNLSGNIVQGYYIADISFKNKYGTTANIKGYYITLYKDSCLNKDAAKDCFFGDQIDSVYGFINASREKICE